MCTCHVCNAHANHPAEGLLGPHSGGLPGKVRMLEKCLSTPIFRACGTTNLSMSPQRPSVHVCSVPPPDAYRYTRANYMQCMHSA